MQYPTPPSFQPRYHASPHDYSSTLHYSKRPPDGYGAQHTTPQAQAYSAGYGVYNTASAQPSSQITASSSSSGSYDNPRASKRPRLDGGPEDVTPSRSSGSWTPMTGTQSQYTNQPRNGLALPPMASPPRPADPTSRQSLQDVRNHGQQSARPEEVTSHLEQQVRGLAEYSQPQRDHYAGSPINQQHQSRTTWGVADAQTDADPTQLMLPERGAKDGNMLNLACVMCMKKKRKCSKNFPCNECKKYEDQCVPSVRKIRGSGVSNADRAVEEPHEQPQEEVPENQGPPPEKRVVRDHNDPDRRYLLTMPRVVDGYQEWSNMRLKYNPMPEDVDAVREKLFKLEKPMLLSSQQFADYWPHVSNIYARGTGPTFEMNGTQVETWECRNQRRQSRHQRVKESSGQGLRKRERKFHLLEGTEMCKVRFRTVAYIKHAENDEDHKKGLGTCNCVPEWLFLERKKMSADLSHNHSLESLDKYKRTDALLFFAEQKVLEGGFLYKTVRKWIYDKYSHISKEVEHLTDHDVANAARRWRVQNRDLELVDTIPEPSPENERLNKCLKLIHSTKVDGLQLALKAVCERLPEATAIALPHLESSQVAQPQNADDNPAIIEGDDIVIPPPGVPGHRFNTYGQTNEPNQELTNFVASRGNAKGSHINQGPPGPLQPLQAIHQTPMAHANPNPYYPVPHNQPLPPPPLPAQSHLPRLAPMPPPSQPIMTKFRVYQPPVETPPPPRPSPGAHSVIGGGHRHSVPATGSRVSPPAQDMRPSWAKPDIPTSTQAPKRINAPESSKAKEKQIVETDEMRVQRQLEAELLA